MRKQNFNFEVADVKFRNNSESTIIIVEEVCGIKNKGAVSRLIEKSPVMLDLLWKIKIYGHEACKKEVDSFFNTYYDDLNKERENDD